MGVGIEIAAQGRGARERGMGVVACGWGVHWQGM